MLRRYLFNVYDLKWNFKYCYFSTETKGYYRIGSYKQVLNEYHKLMG